MFDLTLTVIPAILSFVLFMYLFSRPNKTQVVYSLLILEGASFVWAFGNMLEVLAADIRMKWYAVQISSLPLNFAGVIWLYFCMTYTHKKLFSNPLIAVFLTLPAIISEILCITNHSHHLFFADDQLLSAGIVGLAFAVTGAAYVSVALSFLFTYAAGQKDISKKKSTYFLVYSALIPLLLEVLYVTDVTFISRTLRLRFLPCFSLSITSIFMVYILFQYRFLDLIPIAQKDIVNNLSEAIVVVDNEGKIIHHNHSFQRNFPMDESNKAVRNIEALIGYLKKEAANSAENSVLFDWLQNPEEREYSTELRLKANQCFLVTVKPVFAFKTEFAGRIISLTDITEYKKLKEAELDVIKERNRIARDVHDTLGHKMTLLLYLLEVISINYEKNPALVKNNIQKAIETAGEGYEELRRSIYGLTFQELEMNNLRKTLNELFSEFTASGMEISFSSEGWSEYYDPVYSQIIYRICQEALTNSLKHGKAKKVSIILQFGDTKIRLYIFNNGNGCKNIKMGVGLLSMRQRIQDVNGNLVFGSNDDGFFINVELPINNTNKENKN
jgi:signal transduction histidine kinase